MIEATERSEHVSKISDYQRGWEAGCRSLTETVVAAMAPTRKGGVLRIDLYKFDAIVERHLSEVGIPRGPNDD